jgi:hypothetical protein
MKKYLFLFTLIINTTFLFADCTNAYSSASYTLSHAKKSLSSNNFDHQQYYAERALDALEKTKNLVEKCGCTGPLKAINAGTESLENAIDPQDWEMGRYYTKKALLSTQDVLSFLDMCTEGGTESSYALKADGYLPEDHVNSEITEETKKTEELQSQYELKRMAEITLSEFEKKIGELASVLGCHEVSELLAGRALKSEEELKGESLETTRTFYRDQTITIQKALLQALLKCSENK